MIAMDILDPEGSAEDGSIDDDDSTLCEEDYSGLGEPGVITGVTKVLTKDVKEVNHFVKSSYLFPCMLKPYYVLTQQFKENKKAQDKLFNHICDVESRSVWGVGEEPSVLILILMSENINTVCSI